MTQQTRTTTRLRDLRRGDRIVGIDTISHARKPLVVEWRLDYITPGSPVQGVRCGTLAGGTEMVLYPSQCDGRTITFLRDGMD